MAGLLLSCSPGAARAVVVLAVGCTAMAVSAGEGVGHQPTSATAVDGSFISWQEHIIDDPAVGAPEVSGGDGLAMADLDDDGYLDIVSVHESDVVIGGTTFEDQYDGVARGHIRVAWGSADPAEWSLGTLAAGADAGGAEDVALVDLNGDGFIDVLAACELAHVLYLQNPGNRTSPWKLLKPAITRNRGSFIRVFAADFNDDGQAEVVAVNKGAQNPTAPLGDLDGDGDLDIVGASTAERRIFWFENVSGESVDFAEHPIAVPQAAGEPVGIWGFNMEFADFDADGRIDIVAQSAAGLVWLEQPPEPDGVWPIHLIGSNLPDQTVGLRLADIDGDGDPDLMTGGYSRGPRDRDGDPPLTTPLGRLSWFENPGVGGEDWLRHDISRRYRGMFDAFVARDMDADGDVDFVGTRGNSYPYDGVFWLEQRRTAEPVQAFTRARTEDSQEVDLP